MRNKKVTGLLASALLCSTQLVSATENHTRPTPTTPEATLAATAAPYVELEELAFLEGHWLCTDTVAHGARAPQETFTKVDIDRVLNNAWLRAMWQSPSGEKTLTEQQDWALIGYDAAAKEFIQYAFSSTGYHSFAKSSGVQNEQWIFNGLIHNIHGTHSVIRKTIKRLDQHTFELTIEASSDGKTYSAIGGGTCYRESK